MLCNANIIFNAEKTWSGYALCTDFTVKISKDTVFIFLDQINVCTIYPSGLSEEEIKDELMDWISDFSEEMFADAAKWIKTQMEGEKFYA